MNVSVDTRGIHDVLCSNSNLILNYQSIILQVRDKKTKLPQNISAKYSFTAVFSESSSNLAPLTPKAPMQFKKLAEMILCTVYRKSGLLEYLLILFEKEDMNFVLFYPKYKESAMLASSSSYD